ncbi:LysR family transcriptional regulator [Rossellomorea vietnamensis]|uniref:LysR family transcriptional regulator n=1 Tax=Rossellomorea vietnamensis TaxID=218284 RepID=A0A5D4MBA4_9BACI|nr:LysR family transcriptional regulator [Rossellomorea vietnamensis]TYR98260.1 LysR family transcriptional regulator [Rossellomorea vietnamensis]
MNIEQIKYILEVSKEGSITKAAERLHLSPSALSQSITQLEKELGVTIFSRSRKGTTPTSEGKKVLNRGNEMIYSLEKMYKEISVDKEDKLLKIGCSPSITYLVYDAFILFHEGHSNVKVEIIELDQDEILSRLIHGDIDLAFSPFSEEELSGLRISDFLDYQLIYTGYACICAGKHSPLFLKDFVTPEDLKGEKMVMYNSKRSSHFVNSYLPSASLLFTTNNIGVLKSAIFDGHASSLVYNFTFKNHIDVKKGNMAIIPFMNPGKILNYFWVIYNKNKELSYEAQEFQKKMIQVLNE